MKKLPSMVSMALTKEDKAESGYMSMPDSGNEPMYPYGLSISFTQDELTRLGLGDDVEAGDMLKMNCLLKVTCVSKTDTEAGQKMRVEMQITDIGDSDGSDETEAKPISQRLYTKK